MTGADNSDIFRDSRENAGHSWEDNQFANKPFSGLPVAVYICDPQGYITSFNKAAELLWGREPELGKDLWSGSWKIFLPDGRPLPLNECPMARALSGKEAIEGEEIIIQRPDGLKVNVLSYPTPLFDEAGRLTGAVNTLIDITEQRKMEAKQAILAAIIESSDDAIISKTLNGIVTSWNRGAEILFGYTEQEMIGKSITLLIPEDRMDEEWEILKKVRNNIKVEHYETYRLNKQGREIPVSLTISPVKDGNGHIVGASKIARNILKQKETEERLFRYAENLEILYDVSKKVSVSLSADDILKSITDATTRLTRADFGVSFYNVNRQNGEFLMLSALGEGSEGMLFKKGLNMTSGIIPGIFKEKKILRISALDPVYPVGSLCKDLFNEQLQATSYLIVPVLSKSGDVMGGMLYGHTDITHFTREHENLVGGVVAQTTMALENARLYEQIYELNAKKDEFIGLASHELKTPVTSLKGYLQIIEREFPAGNVIIKSFVQKALLQTSKLLNLIADLLDVSKIELGKLPLLFSSFDLYALTKEVVELMQYSTLSHKILLTCETIPVMVTADKQRIEQVIINLLSNAQKYSSNADIIEVCVSIKERVASVSVKDFGMGISKDQQEHIFSRFYRVETSAIPISGLGIGLYISREIIERHNGILQVESEPGKGSVFYFEIPA